MSQRRDGRPSQLVLVLAVLAALAALLGSAGPAASQGTAPPPTTAPTTALPSSTAPEVLDVPVAPPGSEPATGPRLTTEEDAEGDDAPTYLIAGVVVSALATALILVFFLRSRRSTGT